jgi:hypothetical protein
MDGSVRVCEFESGRTLTTFQGHGVLEFVSRADELASLRSWVVEEATSSLCCAEHGPTVNSPAQRRRSASTALRLWPRRGARG